MHKHFIGCYADNHSRDMKHGPKRYGYDVSKCQSTCKAYKYVALQHGGWCSCDNSFSSPAHVYPKKAKSECGSGTAPKGGAWRNAVYHNGKYVPCRHMSPGMIVALKGGKGGHRHYCADEKNSIKCNRNWIRGWEKFKVANAGGGNIALAGGNAGHRHYCADEGHNTVKCNRNWIRQWEKYTVKVLDQNQGIIALQGKGPGGGKWCADEGNVIKCNRPWIQQWEKFRVECISNCGSCPKARL